MIADTIEGIPSHPLVVHLPIVLMPLLLVAVAVLSFKSNWHKAGSIPVALLAIVLFVSSFIARNTGEALEESLGEETALLEKHASYGDRFLSVALLVLIFVLLWSIYGYLFRPKESGVFSKNILRIAVSVLAIGFLSFGSYSVYLTGHSGAKSVWYEDSKSESRGGDGD